MVMIVNNQRSMTVTHVKIKMFAHFLAMFISVIACLLHFKNTKEHDNTDTNNYSINNNSIVILIIEAIFVIYQGAAWFYAGIVAKLLAKKTVT